MSEAIKNKQLVEKFNRYIDYRKTTTKGGSSFMNELKKLGGKTESISDRGGRQSHVEKQRAGRRFAPPRLAHAKAITNVQAGRLARLAPIIEGCARKYQVPVELICGVILQESGGNPRAVSSAGAAGLMQLMPGTARRFGVKNSFDPAQNIEGGTRYLRFLLNKFKGRVDLALAGYNAGEQNVEKYGNRIPPFKQTQDYIPNVLGYTQSMIDLFQYAQLNREELPAHARRV